MRSIIIGGGKVGFNLLKTMKERGHLVTLIERDRALCEKIADETDGNIIWGDGTDLEVLRDAGIEDAEIIAAVTGTDEENLVICQIAKISYEGKTTIARVNNPKNMTMFKTLGIDSTVCSTDVIANLIESELDKSNYRVVHTLERGSMVLAEIIITKESPWCDRMVKDLVLPEECIFTSVLRADNVIYPKGDTVLESGDKVLVISNLPVLSALAKKNRNGGMRNGK